jgi:hypothetical protein
MVKNLSKYIENNLEHEYLITNLILRKSITTSILEFVKNSDRNIRFALYIFALLFKIKNSNNFGLGFFSSLVLKVKIFNQIKHSLNVLIRSEIVSEGL